MYMYTTVNIVAPPLLTNNHSLMNSIRMRCYRRHDINSKTAINMCFYNYIHVLLAGIEEAHYKVDFPRSTQ